MPFSDDQDVPGPGEPRVLTAVPAAGEPERLEAGSIADDRERRLDPSVVTAERIVGAIVSSIVAAGLLVGVLILAIATPRGFGRLLLPAGWLLAAASMIGFSFWWPGVRYRHIAYRVSDQGIRIRRGVLWRSVSSVPRSRVQHTDVSQGPIERLFDLATLIVYTAGTHHASISLGGLPRATALEIRNHLIDGGTDDAV